MPASRAMTGTATVNNCDVNTDGNTGCGVQAPTANSYGPSFNAIGGGIYAMERTSTFIKVWFFPRTGSIPADVKSGAASIVTDNWVSPSHFVALKFADPNTAGYSDRILPEHRLRHRLTFRREQHHHQPDLL